MSTANGCRHRGTGDGPGVPPEWRQGRGGRTLPPSPNPQVGGGVNKQEDQDRDKGEVTPPTPSPLPEDLTSLGDLFNR
jgi:hypothetical protein